MTMPRSPASCLSPWPGLAARLAALLVLAALCGCAAAPAPEIAWLRLPAQAAEPPARGAPTGDTWQLLAPLRLPGYLDRDALMLPSAGDSRGAVLRAADGLRWAEPLRDALPRLLGIDLGLALAAPVWQAPLPPGVVPTRQLRIEVLAFDLQPNHRSVALQARFSLADIYLAVMAGWLGGAAWLPAECPRIATLQAAVAGRPRIAPVWRRHWPG